MGKAKIKATSDVHPNRDALIIDCAYTLVEFMGWGRRGWDDEEVQAAAIAGATVFVDAMKNRLPDNMPDPLLRPITSA